MDWALYKYYIIIIIIIVIIIIVIVIVIVITIILHRGFSLAYKLRITKCKKKREVKTVRAGRTVGPDDEIQTTGAYTISQSDYRI